MLRHEEVLNEVIAKTWSEQDAGFIAGVMVDVPLPGSAKFLSAYMSKYKLPGERVPAAYQQIARFTPTDQLQKVIDQALQENKNDIVLQSFIFKGLQEG
jgi:hypothetical protein